MQGCTDDQSFLKDGLLNRHGRRDGLRVLVAPIFSILEKSQSREERSDKLISAPGTPPVTRFSFFAFSLELVLAFTLHAPFCSDFTVRLTGNVGIMPQRG